MAELPELRTTANANGGSTMMLLDRQRSRSPERVFVPDADTSRREAGLQRMGISRISAISNDRRPESQEKAGRGGFDPAVGRAGWWAALDSDDRKVFNNWALAVIAFYVSLVVLLLVAVLCGVYLPADSEALLASPAIERSSSELPAQAARGIDK
jgi:hypothetical protein